eukprot:TRINITY_DN6440_c0_g2_i1.p1 TRINITY_DN6440_c0_g2~~TRINITY_DN6440_c0_g2_i1.p1  ORF type:complete len:1389 (+),score=333.25 TRINITY_DN6440_c0_g2_i1:268-4434(+)
MSSPECGVEATVGVRMKTLRVRWKETNGDIEQVKVLQFKGTDLISQVVQTVCERFNIPHDDRFGKGLYLSPPLGYWCNNEKELRNYATNEITEAEVKDRETLTTPGRTRPMHQAHKRSSSGSGQTIIPLSKVKPSHTTGSGPPTPTGTSAAPSMSVEYAMAPPALVTVFIPEMDVSRKVIANVNTTVEEVWQLIYSRNPFDEDDYVIVAVVTCGKDKSDETSKISLHDRTRTFSSYAPLEKLKHLELRRQQLRARITLHHMDGQEIQMCVTPADILVHSLLERIKHDYVMGVVPDDPDCAVIQYALYIERSDYRKKRTPRGMHEKKQGLATSFAANDDDDDEDDGEEGDKAPYWEMLPLDKELRSFCSSGGKIKLEFGQALPPTLQLALSTWHSDPNAITELAITGEILRGTLARPDVRRALRDTGSLVTVSFIGCSLGDNDVSMLCKTLRRSERLRVLDLSNNFISDRGADIVAQLLRGNQGLMYVCLEGNARVSKDHISQLERLLKTRSRLRSRSLVAAPLLSPGGGMPAVKSTNILTLDGGRIRCLFLVKMLMQIEHSTGQRVADLFDLVCGTSFGGVIALAIQRRIPLTDCYKLLKHLGKETEPLMPRSSGSYRKTGGQIFATATTRLAELLRGAFGRDEELFQPKTKPRVFVVAAHRCTLPVQPVLLSSYTGKSTIAHESTGMKIWQAALATISCSPMFSLSVKAGKARSVQLGKRGTIGVIDPASRDTFLADLSQLGMPMAYSSRASCDDLVHVNSSTTSSPFDSPLGSPRSASNSIPSGSGGPSTPDEHEAYLNSLQGLAGGVASGVASDDTSTGSKVSASIKKLRRFTVALTVPSDYSSDEEADGVAPPGSARRTSGSGGTGSGSDSGGDGPTSDGRERWNNPTRFSLYEASAEWPNRPVGCIVSLGTGRFGASDGSSPAGGRSPGPRKGSDGPRPLSIKKRSSIMGFGGSSKGNNNSKPDIQSVRILTALSEASHQTHVSVQGMLKSMPWVEYMRFDPLEAEVLDSFDAVAAEAETYVSHYEAEFDYLGDVLVGNARLHKEISALLQQLQHNPDLSIVLVLDDEITEAKEEALNFMQRNGVTVIHLSLVRELQRVLECFGDQLARLSKSYFRIVTQLRRDKVTPSEQVADAVLTLRSKNVLCAPVLVYSEGGGLSAQDDPTEITRNSAKVSRETLWQLQCPDPYVCVTSSRRAMVRFGMMATMVWLRNPRQRVENLRDMVQSKGIVVELCDSADQAVRFLEFNRHLNQTNLRVVLSFSALGTEDLLDEANALERNEPLPAVRSRVVTSGLSGGSASEADCTYSDEDWEMVDSLILEVQRQRVPLLVYCNSEKEAELAKMRFGKEVLISPNPFVLLKFAEILRSDSLENLTWLKEMKDME